MYNSDNIHHYWFCENGMALNPTKSVAILFGTPKRLKSFSGLKSCNVAGTDIQLSDKVNQSINQSKSEFI